MTSLINLAFDENGQKAAKIDLSELWTGFSKNVDIFMFRGIIEWRLPNSETKSQAKKRPTTGRDKTETKRTNQKRASDTTETKW